MQAALVWARSIAESTRRYCGVRVRVTVRIAELSNSGDWVGEDIATSEGGDGTGAPAQRVESQVARVMDAIHGIVARGEKEYPNVTLRDVLNELRWR